MANLSRLIVLIFCLLLFQCETFSKTEANKSSDSTHSDTKEIENRASNEFLIQGQSFSPNDTAVYLYKVNDNNSTLVDSTIINNRKFNFKGIAETPSMYRVSEIKNKTKGYPILVDASNISLFLNKRNAFSTVYSSSTIQKEYQNYTSQMNVFKDKGMALYYGLKGDFSSKNIKSLKKQRLNLFAEQNDYVKSFVKGHSDSYLSAMLLKNHIEVYSPKTLRTLYNGLSKDIKDLAFTKQINALIVKKETKTNIKAPVAAEKKAKKTEKKSKGEYRPKAYAIKGLNHYGQSISLNSIPKGKVILVDFWASWCGPCRATNPNLVNLYNKYNSQGFEILSISEDKGEAEWVNAIAKDNLTWDYHIIDKNKSIAFRYGVESIPFKLLIDKNGKIASEKISGSALEGRIQQLLKE